MVQKLVRQSVRTTPTNLVQRGSTYYFRYTPNQRHRLLFNWLPREVKVSLRTDDFETAHYLLRKRDHLLKLLRLTDDSDLLAKLYMSLMDRNFGVSEWVGLHTPEEVRSREVPKQLSGVVGLTLHEAWCKYSTYKGWTEKTASTNLLMYENICNFLGAETDVGVLTKHDLRSCLQQISLLPKRNIKKYKGMSLSEALAASVPDEDRLSGKYVREHLKLMQGLFSGYLTKHLELLVSSPTDGVSYEYADTRFGCLPDAEVVSVVTKAAQCEEWVYYFVLLAAYSGARRSEIANLKMSDFKVDADGISYFIIKKGKTAAAVRRVPIHSELIKRGLLHYVKASTDLLFSVAHQNPNRVTDAFNDLLSLKTSEFGERLSLHSLRHTFVTKARSKGVEIGTVQELVGHSKRGAGVTDRYTHRYELADLRDAVEKIRY